MASVNQSTLNGRQIQAALSRSVRDTLVANGIQPTTRRSTKELTLAVQRLAQQSYDSLDEATEAGQALGQKIVERSQAKGKTELDGGIVRQLMLTGEIPMLGKAKAQPTNVAAADVSAPQTPAMALDPSPEAGEPALAEAMDEATDFESADIDQPLADPLNEMDLPPTGETVDAAIADAPDLDAIETLEPADIEAPDSEPITAAETAGNAQ